MARIAGKHMHEEFPPFALSDSGEWMPEASLSLRRQQPSTSATPECCSKMFPSNSAWATLLPCNQASTSAGSVSFGWGREGTPDAGHLGLQSLDSENPIWDDLNSPDQAKK